MLRAAALLMVATLGVSACRSELSAQRVAEDLINTLAKTDEERDCMLKVIDGYTTDELEALGNDAQSSDKATAAEADKALKKFEADLAACR